MKIKIVYTVNENGDKNITPNDYIKKTGYALGTLEEAYDFASLEEAAAKRTEVLKTSWLIETCIVGDRAYMHGTSRAGRKEVEVLIAEEDEDEG